MKTIITALAALLLAALAACQAGTSVTPAAAPPAPITTLAITTPVGSCHARADAGQPLPDPACTPGALNPAVTQATIHSTICVSGWSTQQRKRYLPSALAAKYKRQVEADYGVTPGADVEADHEVPIEAGGLPGPMPGLDFAANFWPEHNDHPSRGVLNSKDLVENAAHAAVCADRLPLATAQAGFEHDWVTLGRQLGVRIP